MCHEVIGRSHTKESIFGVKTLNKAEMTGTPTSHPGRPMIPRVGRTRSAPRQAGAGTGDRGDGGDRGDRAVRPARPRYLSVVAVEVGVVEVVGVVGVVDVVAEGGVVPIGSCRSTMTFPVPLTSVAY